MGGSQGERAVADNDRGGSVIARKGTKRIPRDLGVVVRVVIDDPGRNHQASCIKHPARVSTYLSDLHNTTAADGDVAVESRYAGTIDDISVFDDQIVCHCYSFAAGERHIATLWPNCRSAVVENLFVAHDSKKHSSLSSSTELPSCVESIR